MITRRSKTTESPEGAPPERRPAAPSPPVPNGRRATRGTAGEGSDAILRRARRLGPALPAPVRPPRPPRPAASTDDLIQRQIGLKRNDPVWVDRGEEEEPWATTIHLVVNKYLYAVIDPEEKELCNVPEPRVSLRTTKDFERGIDEDKNRIMRVLMKAGGFVPLKNSNNDSETLKAFGLDAKRFGAAFVSLWKTEDRVYPSKDGLHLKEDEKERSREVEKEGKVRLFLAFSAMMKKLGYEVFLSGGAVANLAYGSPREMKDLDYRTEAFDKPFDELPEAVSKINEAVAKTFPSAKIDKFVVNEKNGNAIDGEIDGVEVTVARVLGTKYETAGHLISGLDLMLDKATSFIFRHSDRKKATDLFDLLWSMKVAGVKAGVLKKALVESRKQSYGRELKSKQSVKKGYYSPDLDTQLAVSLGAFLARGMTSVRNVMYNYVPKGAVQQVVPVLEDVARVFGIPFLAKAGNRAPSVIVQAGNMTGDMFGVSAALIHNPLAHVVIIGEDSKRDRSRMLAGFYLQTVGDKKRIHVLVAEEDPSGIANMSKLYTRYAGRDKELLPHGKIQPGLPTALHTPELQQPVSGATSQTAALWQSKQGESHRTMRQRWGVDSKTRKKADSAVKTFLKQKGVPLTGSFVALWSRFSGKRGGPHAQHDTSFTGTRQIVALALAEGHRVLLVGDKGDSVKTKKLLEAGGGKVYDLSEFWNDPAWTEAFPDGRRTDQLLLFDYLHQNGKLKHLGFRSGNLEAYALIGHTVRYMEERGNLQAGRMEAWHSRDERGGRKGDLAYDRILIGDRVPSLTGQWVTETAKTTGSEKKPPWIEFPEEYVKKALLSMISIPDDPREKARRRGFTTRDLRKIHDYLAPEKKAAPTWLVELYRKHAEYRERGWKLGYDDLDATTAVGLVNHEPGKATIKPEWMDELRTECDRVEARFALLSLAQMYGWSQSTLNEEIEKYVEEKRR